MPTVDRHLIKNSSQGNQRWNASWTFFVLEIFFWSCSSPYMSASAVRWASRDVNVHWYDAITATYYRVGVVVVPASVCT